MKRDALHRFLYRAMLASFPAAGGCVAAADGVRAPDLAVADLAVPPDYYFAPHDLRGWQTIDASECLGSPARFEVDTVLLPPGPIPWDGGNYWSQCTEACDPDGQAASYYFRGCIPNVGADGVTAVLCYFDTLPPGGCTGRRPEGFVERTGRAGSPIGQWLARAALLEAASVPAFERLATELAAHGAPRALVVRARAAARDEVRHTRWMRRLAPQQGTPDARLPSSKSLPMHIRPLLDVAVENATEGCVRETFGVPEALRQSRTAALVGLRGVMTRIARDEARHAALSFAVDGWARSRLSPGARATLEARREAAVTALAGEIEAAAELPTGYRQSLGLPTQDERRAWHAAARGEVWRSARSRG